MIASIIYISILMLVIVTICYCASIEEQDAKEKHERMLARTRECVEISNRLSRESK